MLHTSPAPNMLFSESNDYHDILMNIISEQGKQTEPFYLALGLIFSVCNALHVQCAPLMVRVGLYLSWTFNRVVAKIMYFSFDV